MYDRFTFSTWRTSRGRLWYSQLASTKLNTVATAAPIRVSIRRSLTRFGLLGATRCICSKIIRLTAMAV